MSRTHAGRFLVAVAALAAAVSQAPAQSPDVARKVDEFGHAAGCDHSARLDSLAIELQNRPDYAAVIIAYGPAGERAGTADFRLRLTRDYLVNTRGIDAGRVKTVNGGPYRERGESYAEFWVVPHGAAEPEPARYENDAGSFKGKFAEYESWDETSGWEVDAGTGPSVPRSALAGFAEALRLQPKTVGYVVAYSGEEDAPGAWRRIGDREAEGLKGHGIDPGRLKVLFGGYRKETTVRLWLLPEDAPPPVKGDVPERRPERAARLGEFDRYFLKYEENERRVFKGFAETLKADGLLNACVVVRPEPAGVEEFDPDAPRDPEEPPDIDLLKLAEKWRSRLAKEYGVGEHRFFLLVAAPSEDASGGYLETWVVPAGAALPDTDAPAEPAAEEENPKEF